MASHSVSRQLLPGEIIDKIVQVDGLYERIFGKLLDIIVYNRRMEANFYVLEKIMGYKDIRDLAPRKIDKRAFKQLSNTIFRYSEDAEKKSAEKKVTNS